jgi:isopenicillin N synthase-like dioxygenase
VTIKPVSFTGYDRDFDAFARELGQSFERYGFAVIADHDLSPELIKGATEATKAFFALPEAVKMKYKLAGAGGQRGYTPFGIETAKGADHFDLKEFWHAGRHLGLADDYFEKTVHLGNSILRLLHYPPVAFDGPNVRAGAHEDINTITLLLGAEEAGLQLKEKNGDWLDVNPPEGSVVCNIGDMLQRLTNHVLPSTTHRVVNPAPERRGVARYSMPFFLHFAPDFDIETLPSTITADRPNRYPASITAEEYLNERLREIKLA